jgi:micrococcal nuclease
MEVRSGDLMLLQSGEVARLTGIDVPWRGRLGANAARMDLARLAEGRQIELFYGGTRRDDYGRLMIQARRADDRRWLQCALLRDGVARVRTDPDNHSLARAMLACEAEGRAHGRGLWTSMARQVRLPAEIDDRSDDFEIVEGRLSRTTATSGGVYLDFDGAAGGFAARIVVGAVHRFRGVGLEPSSLAGRLVRIRGVVIRGLMRLDHPEQVEILKDR